MLKDGGCVFFFQLAPKWSLVRLRAIKVDLKESPKTLAKASMGGRFDPLVICKIKIINEKRNKWEIGL